jgi:hypothetical protein
MPARRANDKPDDLSERAKAWVERSCAEQGVPVKVSDLLVLAKVADILLSAREKRSPTER